MKKRNVYWLCHKVTPLHDERVNVLAQKGVEVQFFNNINDLLKYYTLKRVNVIIVSDDGPRELTERELDTLSSHPNLYGVRLILSVDRNVAHIVNKAYQLGFRDILPLDLMTKLWVKRLLFSSSSRASHIASGSMQVSFKEIAGVYVPGRIVSLSHQRVRLEARIKVSLGTHVTILGGLAAHLGMNALRLEVENLDVTNLRYRFSDALICRLLLPPERIPRLETALELLARDRPGHELKVFAAIKTVVTRNQLIEILGRSQVHLATALNKNHIIEEPKYLGPHIVLLEDLFCHPDDLTLFSRMVDHLPDGIPIVIVGERRNIDDLKSLAPGHRVYVLPKIRDNLLSLILNHYLTGRSLNNTVDEENTIRVGINSRFSSCEIYLPSRQISIHPEGASFRVPIDVGRYGLCRVESPWIRKIKHQVYGKVIRNYLSEGEQNDNHHIIEVAFANLLRHERSLLSGVIVDRMIKTYSLNKELFVPENTLASVQDDSEDIKIEPFVSELEAVPVQKTRSLAHRDIDRKSAEDYIPILGGLLFILSLVLFFYWALQHYDPSEGTGGVFSDSLEKFIESHKK